jgi:hypothetical protein
MISCDGASSDDNGTPPNTPEQPQTDLQRCPQEKISTYTLVTKLEGELTSSDCLSEGTSPIDYYKFSVVQSTAVTFFLRTSGTDFGIRLFDSNQQELNLEPTDPYYFRKYKRQLMPGDYTLAVQTIMGNMGKYVLTTTLEQGFSGCLILTKLELGIKVEGEITTADCVGGSDYIDYYKFSLPEQDTIAICGGAGRSLFLRDGTVLESDIRVRTGCAFRDLQPGSYVIAEYARSQERSYSISVTTTSTGFLFCYDVKPFVSGVSQQGKIDKTDCGWPPFPYGCTGSCGSDYGYADYYGFELDSPKQVEVVFDFSGERPFWRMFNRTDGYRIDGYTGNTQLAPGKYVLVVGYSYVYIPPSSSIPLDELELYSLTIHFK